MNIYRRLFAYIVPYRLHLAVSMVAGLLVSGLTALAALLVKPVLDDIFVRQDAAKLYVFPLLIVGLYVARGLSDYVQSYFVQLLGQGVVRDLRHELFAHMQGLPLAYFHTHHTGALMSRIIHDISLMQQAMSTAVNTLLRQSVTMLALIGVAFYRDWFLATCATLVLPLASFCVVEIGRRLRRLSRRSQEEMGRLCMLLEEVLSSIAVVKGFGREGYECERFQTRNTAYYELMMRSVRVGELGSPIMEGLGALGIAAVVFYGGQQVIAGATTPGTFFSFLTAVLMLYEPLRKLSRANSTLQGAAAAAERVFTLLDTPSETDGETAKPSIAPLCEELVFTDVALRYQPESALVLQDINLHVRAGEVVALVGMSGAGKSSLVQLLPRFFEPSQGRITIDGVDISQVSLSSLRAQIGLVSQDVVLFDDTLRHNILYGHPTATERQLQAAAEAAYVHEVALRLPEGYDTVIGERGVKLSGGEKQRVAIARAVLRNAPILILDEATSALDSASEQVVQQALLYLMKDRTTFVIAHRLSTIRHADKIVVLHAGRIVEIGSHEALLERGGHYSRLYELQFKPQESSDSLPGSSIAPLPDRGWVVEC
jgi:subfamily B ATP-binding cassette protein MsbA